VKTGSPAQIFGFMRSDENVRRLNALKEILVSRATGRPADDNEYKSLRLKFASNKALREKTPTFLLDCQDLSDFWSFIKSQSPTYEGRRNFIRDSLKLLYQHAEQELLDGYSIPPPEKITPAYIHEEWAKAAERAQSDPRGAITAARTLLEATCKHILSKNNLEYADDDDLPKLYGHCAKHLNLHPTQHTERIFKQILSGCISIVSGIGSMRNKLGDAHAAKVATPKPGTRHSALAVNISCSLAAFLLETEQALTEKTGKNSRG
jgi:hypothetical protein